MSTPLGPAGWHPDPVGRFEYRYYNGHQWTADVSVGGQRFLDPAGAPVIPPHGIGSSAERPTRGFAVASFVIGLVSLLIAWAPIVVGLAVVGIALALTFGIIGLRRARAQDGHGRGFAVAGITLGALAIPLCIVGVWLSVRVIREVNDYVNPGPYRILDEGCTVTNGLATGSFTIENAGNKPHDYTVDVWVSASGRTTKEPVVVQGLPAGEQRTLVTEGLIFVSAAECTAQVHQVYGPTPFDLNPSDIQGN